MPVERLRRTPNEQGAAWRRPPAGAGSFFGRLLASEFAEQPLCAKSRRRHAWLSLNENKYLEWPGRTQLKIAGRGVTVI